MLSTQGKGCFLDLFFSKQSLLIVDSGSKYLNKTSRVVSRQDVESYIHRSGRTGRAGRTGVCICFYQRKEEDQLRYVENKAVSLLLLPVGPRGWSRAS